MSGSPLFYPPSALVDVTHRLDTALEAAVVVMRNGGSTAAAAESFANILNGCEITGLSTVWRLDFVAASGETREGRLTALRSVGPMGVNLVRAGEMVALSERVAGGQITAEALDVELNRVRSLPSPYSRPVLALAAAWAGAAYSQLPGGDWGSLAIAFVAGGVGQSLRSQLEANRVANTTVTFTCSALSAMIAALGLRLGLSDVPSATLLASVIYMIPGMPLINGFTDMLSAHHRITGLERIANAALIFVVIAIAVALAYAVFV